MDDVTIVGVDSAGPDELVLCWGKGNPLSVLPEHRVIFEKIPKQFRDVMMATGRGLTYEKAALYLGIPIGTVRSRLNRGRAHFIRIQAQEAMVDAVKKAMPNALTINEAGEVKSEVANAR